jgi:asparagine synthase (glutamine-hydrolysing)
MFSLALLDRRERPAKLVLARDRFGIKPLYYATFGKRFIFASEIKSILSLSEVSREVDLMSLHRYLAFLWVPGPETMLKGIHKLLPGHYLIWREGGCNIRSYWDIRFDPRESVGEEQLADELRAVFQRAVKRHMISDVPLGVFLSGGLDSSAITAAAAQISSGPVNTYTIAYRAEDSILEQSDEDASVARVVSAHFGTQHHEILVTPQVADLLPEVVWHMDEPVADPAAISTLLICRAARPKVKVLLSGQGGDEVFAGYTVHLAHRVAGLLRTIPRPLRSVAAKFLLRFLLSAKGRVPGIGPGMILALHRNLHKIFDCVDLPPESRYVSLRSYYTDSQELVMYTPELRATLLDAIAGERHLSYFARANDKSFVNRMLYVDLKTFLPELNLTYSDKLSSAASVEVRVPFLDNEVVEYMARVPANLKLRGTTRKYLLRQAMKGVLPPQVIQRRKAGFGAPVRTWIRRELRTMVDDLLSESTTRNRGYLDPAAVRSMIARNRDGVEDNTLRIWALLTFELWHRTFIDQPVQTMVPPVPTYTS